MIKIGKFEFLSTRELLERCAGYVAFREGITIEEAFKALEKAYKEKRISRETLNGFNEIYKMLNLEKNLKK